MLKDLIKQWWDLLLMVLLLLVTNGHLIGVSDPQQYLLTMDGLQAGGVHRLFTHAFLHTSWYHLLLDSSALFFLYTMISRSPLERLTVFLFALLGSVIGAFIGTAGLLPDGLCGLSGAAHGIIVFVSLRMIQKASTKGERWLYLTAVIVTFCKSMYEVYSGGVLFSSLHMGNVGSPVVSCHLGSVLFILFLYPLYHIYYNGKPSAQTTDGVKDTNSNSCSLVQSSIR